MDVTMHDGSVVRFRPVDSAYDPKDREAAYSHVFRRQQHGEVVTGLLYIEEGQPDMHAQNATVDTPLVDVPYEDLCPGAEALSALQEDFR